MIKRACLSIGLAIFSIVLYSQVNTIKSPYEYFENYGKAHTPHHEVIEYLKYVDDRSERVVLEKYGKSNQGRLLYTLIISNAENIKNREVIRKTNLYNIGIESVQPTITIEKALVWCSFGVHGNEAGTTESVMNIVFQLATANDPKTIQWLNDAVVIIDPSLNPDGYDRYTHWLRNVTGDLMHPGVYDREHNEPWPTGRYNHYCFDLNRDWAWQTQVESQQRNERYNSWMPHIHADFHEMGANENYYFAPAAEPYHTYITPFQRDFQTRIGKNHGAYFDQKGWLYWTREVFDLFYPSYGDTYPTYNGAIGMTYEQAGNSSSGRSIELDNGDTLTINDKITHNTVVALSTIEMGANNAKGLIDNFKKYFRESVSNPKGKYKTYIIKNSPSNGRLSQLLDRHGIQYGYASEKRSLSGATLIGTKSGNQNVNVENGDIIIQASQPKSMMLQILMEEDPALSDSLTYDITAWSVPLAYGSQCYGMLSSTKIATSIKPIVMASSRVCDENASSYIMPWNDLTSAKKLGQLHTAGIKARMAVKETSFTGEVVKRGSIVVHRADNKRIPNLRQEVLNIMGEDCRCLSSGFSDKIGDIGGSYFELLSAPKVLSIAGEGTSTTGAGEVWHFFDRVLKYPVTITEWSNFGSVDLSQYNTLVLPEGRYNVGEHGKAIDAWVRKGGRLITLGSATSQLQAIDGVGVEKYAIAAERDAATESDSLAMIKGRTNPYDGMDRRYISQSTAGTIIKNLVDETHPLSFGLGKEYYSLKTNDQYYGLQKGAWNVMTVPQNYWSAGFIGTGLTKKLENTVSFGTKNIDGGQVIFMVDNPLFRGFWDRGLLLFSNAIFLNSRQRSNY
jgi:hypothetical protein